MSRVTFVVERHPRRPDAQTIGIWIDGVRCAAITPGEADEAAIRITSAHFKGDRGDQELPAGITMMPPTAIPIPMLRIDFELRPYTIEDGTLNRLP